MSTAKRPHPLLAPALLISHLETETLEALLGEVVRVVNEANLRVEKLSSDWELRSQKGEEGLRKLAHTVEVLDERVSGCELLSGKIVPFT